LGAVHWTFAVHALHTPLLQTSPVPQTVPLSALLPVSLQVSPPAPQETEPLWHALAVGTQLEPAVHCVHVPFSQ
jgi:hypothetical protein